VTLTNLGTGEKRAQKSAVDGLYSFVDLNVGRYRLEVEKEGFKHFTREPVVVEVQQSIRIDITMELGAVTQTVEVVAQTPLLQPDTSSLGQVVEERKATELPLNGRNVFNLISLAPSVVPQGQAEGTPVGTNPFGWGNYQVNGSFGNESAEYVDGEPLNIGYINLPVLIPTQDSLQEFKVQTSNLGPEWGKFSGGVSNYSTKSGTNSIHGEVYEYNRNKALNANYDYINSTSIPTPPWTQNQFGANAGGPLVLPGYNGRNKTFWFGSWEGYRQRTASPFTTTVPTQAETTGDFSAITVPLYDPCGGSVSTPVACPTYTGGPTAWPTANVITPARLNPTSVQLVYGGAKPVWPLPNTAGTTAANGMVSDNFVTTTPTGGDQNQYVGRVDQAIGNNQRVFVRYSYWNVMDLPIDPLGTGLCADRCTETYTTDAVAVGYNWSISPTTVLNINGSMSRFQYLRSPKNAGFDLTKIGWPASFNAVIPAPMRTPPTPCVDNFDPSDIMCSQGQSFIADKDTLFNLSPSVTMIRGRHTFLFGGQWEGTLDDYAQTNIAGGSFDYCSPASTCFTAASAAANPAAPFADFMLGFADNPSNLENHFFGQDVIPAFVAGKQTYRALYFGDTWKVTHKLTLNLGLRYEVQGPWSERYNRLSYFSPSTVNWIDSVAGYDYATTYGDVLLVNPSARHVQSTPNNFAPRIGFAYSVTPKTVVRGGYGIFWIPNNLSFGLNPNNDGVNDSTTSYTGTINGIVPSNTISTPWGVVGTTPSPPVPPPGRNLGATGTSAFMTETVQAIDEALPNNHTGYVQQWNINLQRELPGRWFVSAAYVGSRGTHLEQYSQQINQLSDSYLAQAAAGTLTLTTTAANPFYIGGKSLALSGPTTTAGQLLRPYPQYTSVELAGQGSFYSEYNSFQLTGERRFAGAGSLLVAYTNSKLISDTDTLTSWLETGGGVGGIMDNTNLRGERSLASQDVSQRLVLSYVLDLPFGHGKKYLSGVTGPASKLVSGWGLEGVSIFQRGFPLQIAGGASGWSPSLWGAGERPDVVPGCSISSPFTAHGAKANEWFNTACFAAPAAYTFGDESRVDPRLRMDGINNWDFSLFKTTNFGPSERMGIQFRAEFFNLFNRPQYGAPDTTFGTSLFGVVNSIAPMSEPRLVQFALKFLF
jgi:hypothetical protein